MRRICFKLSFAFVLGLATPSFAQTPTPTPDSISEHLFDQLKAGNTKAAPLEFFGVNSLVSKKSTELAYLSSQIDGTIAAYGPIKTCELVDSRKRGTLVESRIYLCQHDSYVTRWKLMFVRTTHGWSGGFFNFDDKIQLGLDD